MFTGIIVAVGKVTAMDMRNKDERVMTIETPFADAELGESIAVNGVCLTVAEITALTNGAALKFFASSETCQRSNLGSLQTTHTVNLERALRAQDRLSGHIVQGHVDGLAKLKNVQKSGDAYELEVELPKEMLKYVVEKGSIALDGISLTLNYIKNSSIYLMIIPHTWTHTILQSKRVGQDFNVELDVVAKYVERLTQYAHNPRGN